MQTKYRRICEFMDFGQYNVFLDTSGHVSRSTAFRTQTRGSSSNESVGEELHQNDQGQMGRSIQPNVSTRRPFSRLH